MTICRTFKSALPALGIALASGLAASALAQPANDLCANAQVLTVSDPFVRVSGTTIGASSDLASSTCGTNDSTDVWYSFVAPRSGRYGITTLQTSGATNPFDTTLSAYSVCGGTSLTCNDDLSDSAIFGNTDSRINLTLTANQIVLVRVAGHNNSTGTFNLTIAPPALNDRCADAQVVTLAQMPIVSSNLGSTTSFQIGTVTPPSNLVIGAANVCTNADSGSRGQFDVFYRFTPTSTGPYTISTCGSDFDTSISVYAGCPANSDNGTPNGPAIGTAPVLACSEDAVPPAACAGELQAEIESVTLNAGMSYIIRVNGYDYTSSLVFGPGLGQGVFTLNITGGSSGPTPPPNDTCASAQNITSVPFSSGQVLIAGATDDADIACNAPNAAAARNGIWYTYTPTTNCTLVLTPESNTGASIAVFTGACNALTSVDCSGNGFTNENMTVPAIAGTTYRILVARFDGAPASATETLGLNLQCVTPVANDLPCNAIEIQNNLLITGDNANATNQNDGPAATCQALAGKGVWYFFTSPVTQAYTITTCGSAQNTVLQVFAVGQCGNPGTWSTIACDDDTCNQQGGTSGAAIIADLPIAQGTTYYIRVSSFRGVRTTPPGGAFSIQITGSSVGTAVCCRGSTCVVLPAADCVAPPPVGVFQADASTCNVAGVNNTPCCHADFNKEAGVTLDDIFLFLNSWFGTSPFAKVGGDGTGTPLLDDIFLFLNAWFAGC